MGCELKRLYEMSRLFAPRRTILPNSLPRTSCDANQISLLARPRHRLHAVVLADAQPARDYAVRHLELQRARAAAAARRVHGLDLVLDEAAERRVADDDEGD